MVPLGIGIVLMVVSFFMFGVFSTYSFMGIVTVMTFLSGLLALGIGINSALTQGES